MATKKKFALELKTRHGTYHVDSVSGEILENLDGYELLDFEDSRDALPDLEDIQDSTEPEDYGPTQPSNVTDRFGPSPQSEASGSGNVMSRRTAPNDTLRPMDVRKDVERSKDLPSKLAGVPTGMAMAGVGAALGSVAGPIGTLAGGLLGQMAGKRIGGFVVDDMRQNPQTMAQPGKTTKAQPKNVPVPKDRAPRTNPMLDRKVEAVTRNVPVEEVVRRESLKAPSYNPRAARPDQMGYETVDSAAFGQPQRASQPSRPVTPTPRANATPAPVGAVSRSPLGDVVTPGNLPASPVGAVTRSPIADIARPTNLAPSPVGQVQRGPLGPVAQRSNPLLEAAVSRAVTPAATPTFAPMTGTLAPGTATPSPKPARQVMPELNYDRFNAKAPSVNWGGIDPDEVDPYTREKIEEAQSQLDFSINITSGFRDKATNARVGGASKSQHTHGRAADISLSNLDDDQRSDLVSALGRVSEKGKGRVGAYSGNTGLHYDTAPHSTQNYGGLHPMYDKTIKNMDRAPSWFSKGLQAVEKQDYTSLDSRKVKGFNIPDETPNPFAEVTDKVTQGPQSPRAGELSLPGAFTSSGYYDRPEDEKTKMGFTIAGELSQSTLQGLRENDPQARAELANVVATMENRAHSTRYDGDINGVLSPSQYNSLNKNAISTTRNNWGAYGQDIKAAVDDYYSGKNKPTTPEATHYANYDVVTPSWDQSAVNKQKVGDHTFSVVNLKDSTIQEYNPSIGFQTEAQRAIDKAINEATKESFDENISNFDPFKTRTEQAETATPKSTSFSSVFNAGYAGYSAPTLGSAINNSTTGGFMGTPSSYAGGYASVGDGGVSYTRADGSTRNADGSAYDPWSGMRNRTGGNGGGGFGSGTMSDSARDSAKSGGGLF